MSVAPSEGKTMTTVLICGSVAGDYLTPTVVYKGSDTQMPILWTQGGPPNNLHGSTPSGWMEGYLFESLFLNEKAGF